MKNNDMVHKRYNPLADEWVLVSPHRRQRPWQGQEENAEVNSQPQHNPSCYLCPGTTRANGEVNPDYTDTYVFTNDFAALLPERGKIEDLEASPLFRAEPEAGICRVVCFSPRHDLSIARMEQPQVRKIVDTWEEQYLELGAMDLINYVQIFENRGDSMGCSNPHPHGQIWATSGIPTIPSREQNQQQQYQQTNKTCLLCDYLEQELVKKERVIFENNSFVALVPYWAVWPFETMILPKSHLGSLDLMSTEQKDDLAQAMLQMGTRFDNLFKTSFPYSMGIHQQPVDGDEHGEWHFHLHYYPPLLRSATVKKFMVGFEMLAMPQRDLTAEESAERLREQSDIHYLETIA